jgi:hypothetical protein
MAKAKHVTKSKKKKIEHLHINLTNKNYMIIGVGILSIIIGYFFMSENSVDGFLPTVIAPILLVAGYCVIVPIGILYNDRSQEVSAEQTINVTNTASASNIKTN